MCVVFLFLEVTVCMHTGMSRSDIEKIMPCHKKKKENMLYYPQISGDVDANP